MKYTDEQRIEKIVSYTDKLLAYIKDNHISKDDVMSNETIHWTLTTPLYNIGEHVYYLSDDFRERNHTELFQKIREDKTMYDILRDMFNDEYEAAENRGLEKGRKSILEKMLRKGKTPEEIAELTDISIDVVRKIQESMMQLA